MAVPNSNASFSGDGNQGVEVALNSGHIHVNFGGRQDRDILAQIEERYLKPASRIALYGLGGVG
ncbi:MAG: hypothetical protein Q9191_008441 [Dirinaria sp. TL-2023a]